MDYLLVLFITISLGLSFRIVDSKGDRPRIKTTTYSSVIFRLRYQEKVTRVSPLLRRARVGVKITVKVVIPMYTDGSRLGQRVSLPTTNKVRNNVSQSKQDLVTRRRSNLWSVGSTHGKTQDRRRTQPENRKPTDVPLTIEVKGRTITTKPKRGNQQTVKTISKRFKQLEKFHD